MAELAGLPGPYAPPQGRLLLARDGAAALGVVALKRFADDIAEIKRLYYNTTRQTIHQDLAKALELLKSMASEEERERAAVYMDGLAQMRSDWGRVAKSRPRKGKEKR